MFWGTLHRMILLELLKVFTVALVALTGLILMAGIVSEAMKSGLSPSQMLAAIPLLLPSTLPYTVPTTTLFATCIVYGRLSADNEIVALKAAGIHVVHVIWPALFLGIVTSAATMYVFFEVVPVANFGLRMQASSDIEELLYTVLRRDGYLRRTKVNYEIHVQEVVGRKLIGAVFKRRAPGNKGFDTIAFAREAELHVDKDQANLFIHMRDCQLMQANSVGVLQTHVWPVEIPRELTSGRVKARAMDMTWSELDEYEESTLREKEDIRENLDYHQEAVKLGKGGKHFTEHVQHLLNERKKCDQQIYNIHSEWHMRIAIALGCFCFALIGCPVGIWFSKSDYLSAFITCFVPIVTIYYPLLFCMINMVRAGKCPGWMTIYNADALLLLAGLILFRRLSKN